MLSRVTARLTIEDDRVFPSITLQGPHTILLREVSLLHFLYSSDLPKIIQGAALVQGPETSHCLHFLFKPREHTSRWVNESNLYTAKPHRGRIPLNASEGLTRDDQ